MNCEVYVYLFMIDQNFPAICAFGHGISTDKKKYCLWFIQSSNKSLGTRVPEHFWDFLWKFSNNVGMPPYASYRIDLILPAPTPVSGPSERFSAHV